MGVKHLDEAKARRYDEYYTRYEDVAKEMIYYKDSFKGKRIYCNCDDNTSAFYKYFKDHFHEFGLEALMATGIKGEKFLYDGIRETVSGIADGRYQSDECKELLKWCDIVVTNPPFSLWRDYYDTVYASGKKFIILGHLMCGCYVNVFPAVKAGEVWYGSESNRVSYWFDVPNDAPSEVLDKLEMHDGRLMRSMRQIVWVTNIRHDVVKHLECTAHYTPEKYPHYADYDAIEVGALKDVPCDYDGVMGVPITFLSNHNPDEFEVVDNVKPTMPDGTQKFQRILIKRKA